MSDAYLDCKSLLAKTAELYEKHEAGRPEPFNVFLVLNIENDEVKHSRFLHALLDHQKPGDETKENLKDFLQNVAEKDFVLSAVTVKRESDQIDILITNDKQAVAIENKIWAKDQPKQLQRYHKTLENKGYTDIHLLYLTPHGHAPSEDSVGNLDYKLISYKDDLPPWLKRCQQRAYAEPELRESVAQYRQLVRKLTGTDYTGVYMEALKKLCLEGNNLVLVHNLHEAMIEARISLLTKLWREIECALEKNLSELPEKANGCIAGGGIKSSSDISENRITKFVREQKNYKYHGLHYGLHYDDETTIDTWLSVEVEDSIYFGVICLDKNKKRYHELKKKLNQEDDSGKEDDGWPWYKWAGGALDLKNPNPDTLKLLSNEAERKKYAKGIAQDLKPVWEVLKKCGFQG